MNLSKMIHQANSICDYFKSYGKEKAILGIADHIQKFWEPRMKKQINDYVHSGMKSPNPVPSTSEQPAVLHEYVIEAVKQLPPDQ